jgi:iron complex transport system ATP-binding protein
MVISQKTKSSFLMKEQKHIITAENVTVGYQKKSVAAEISFQLEKGKLIALVGPNGIGKSTLLKTICGIEPPIEGNLWLQQTKIQHYTPQGLAKQLAVVLTEHIPPSNLTVKEIIALGRQPYTNWIGTLTADDKNNINEVIALLDIANIADKRSFELSDGQLQKVMLGRALAQDTPIIVLDEPTTHLDIYHKAYIFKLLKDICVQTKKTILFSTHEIDMAIQLCDEMMVLTKDTFIIDQPCNLISKGAFNTLFPEGLIYFDKNSGSFKVQK